MATNKKDKYYIKTVESSSPVSKLPSTPFRLAKLGLLEEIGCYVPKDTTTVGGDTVLQSDLPIMPGNSVEKIDCNTVLIVPKGGWYIARVQEIFELQFDHGSFADKPKQYKFSGISLPYFAVEGGILSIALGEVGEHLIDIEIVYDECNSCKLQIPVKIESEPEVPGEPGVPSEPGGACMPEDPTPFEVIFPEGSVEPKDRSCATVIKPKKVQEYKDMATYEWKTVPGAQYDLNLYVKQVYGQEFSFDGADFWTGIEYIHEGILGDIDEDYPFHIKGYNPNQEVIEEVAPGFLNVDISEDWTTFHDTAYSNYGIEDCASSTDKASLWLTARLKVVTVLDDEMKWICASPIMEMVDETLREIHVNKLIHIIRGRDILPDAEGLTTGAFVSDFTVIPEFLGIFNIEPQLDLYTMDGQVTFMPIDYKSVGTEWHEYEAVLPIDYVQFAHDSSNMTDEEKKAVTTACIMYHELAHALDNKYMDVFGTALSEEQGWLELSGWVRDSNSLTGYRQMKKEDFGIADGDVRPPPTPYGCYIPAEDFAESYAMYKFNPKFLCYYHPKKYRYVKDIEKKLFDALGEEFYDNGIECPNCEYTPEEPEIPEEPIYENVGNCDSVESVRTQDGVEGVGDKSLIMAIHGDKAELFERFEQLNGLTVVKLVDPEHIDLYTEILQSGSYTVKFRIYYSDGSECILDVMYNGGGELPPEENPNPTDPGGSLGDIDYTELDVDDNIIFWFCDFTREGGKTKTRVNGNDIYSGYTENIPDVQTATIGSGGRKLDANHVGYSMPNTRDILFEVEILPPDSSIADGEEYNVRLAFDVLSGEIERPPEVNITSIASAQIITKIRDDLIVSEDPKWSVTSEVTNNDRLARIKYRRL